MRKGDLQENNRQDQSKRGTAGRKCEAENTVGHVTFHTEGMVA